MYIKHDHNVLCLYLRNRIMSKSAHDFSMEYIHSYKSPLHLLVLTDGCTYDDTCACKTLMDLDVFVRSHTHIYLRISALDLATVK